MFGMNDKRDVTLSSTSPQDGTVQAGEAIQAYTVWSVPIALTLDGERFHKAG